MYKVKSGSSPGFFSTISLIIIGSLLLSACGPVVRIKYVPLQKKSYRAYATPAIDCEGSVEQLIDNNNLLIGYLDFTRELQKCYDGGQCISMGDNSVSDEEMKITAGKKGSDCVYVLRSDPLWESFTESSCTTMIPIMIPNGKGGSTTSFSCVGYVTKTGKRELMRIRVLLWRQEEEPLDEENYIAMNRAFNRLMAEISEPEDASKKNKNRANQAGTKRQLTESKEPDPQLKPYFLALHAEGESANIDEIIKLQKFIEWRDEKNRDALMWAFLAGKIEIAEKVIQSGYPLTHLDADGWSILSYAAQMGRAGILKLLKSKGVELDQIVNGHNILHLASNNPSNENLLWLIEQGWQVDILTYDGNTPLHLALLSQSTGNVESLIANGADIEYETVYGYTPLMAASRSGHIDGVKLLLKNGAKINRHIGQGRYALTIAIFFGQIKVLDYLIKHGATVTHNSEYITPMEAAIAGGQCDSIGYLLDLKPDPLVLREPIMEPITGCLSALHNRQTVLRLIDHLNPELHQNAIIDILAASIEKEATEVITGAINKGLDINQKILLFSEPEKVRLFGPDTYPIIYAAVLDKPKSLTKLLELGADPNVWVGNNTALSLSVSRKHAEVIKILKEAGAK
jgi:ankyrin repeat protein